ncbi:MAG: alpha/beta fold hydrolase [Candidatus Aminicenantes bacterium]|nr:alpha/beta fold hydrolase [Candidatus Aminicenantes bacterium]
MPELQGTNILFRRWPASPEPASPKAVFLLVHGLGAYSARWGFLAGHLAEHGFASYAVELRGFGRTPERPRGHIGSFRVWDRDILELGDIARRENPGKKIFLLGESLGGLLAFNLACRNADKFAGQVLIAPAFKNRMKFPLSAYLKLVSLLLFNPTLMVDVPFTSEMVTRDPEYLQVMNASPDELRVASLKCLFNFLPEQAGSRRLAKKLAVPTLFLIPGADLLVDERAGRKMFQKLPLADKTLLEYPDMLHALSIDLGREKVFKDILDWVAPRA